MQAHKLSVKFFVEDASAIRGDEFVPIFHSWIQLHAVPEHLLIDVADYEHVHNGPGTVLVAHEANFYTDRGQGRLGLMYNRKQPAAGTFADRMRQAFAAALEACARLEGEERLAGRIRFRTDEIQFRIYDRLLAPNTAETFAAVKPDLERLLRDLYGGAEFALERRQSSLSVFEVRIRSLSSPPVSELLSHLSAAAPAPAR
jgi:hypothetical protein